MIIDSHCHIDTDRFDADRDAVLMRAAEAGVSRMIVIGAGGGLSDCDRATALVAAHDHLWMTLGVHPHHASACDDATLQAISEASKTPKVIAIGETGLDYFYDTSPREAQQNAFRAFVRMARERSLPLVLHVRDAHNDAIALLEQEDASEVGGVVHCFTGTRADAERYLALGFHLGITGIVTFKRAGEVPDVVAQAPLERLLVETDSPFLAPHPHRGRRNEPAFVSRVVAAIAAIRDLPFDVVARVTTENANRLFSLPS